MEHDRATPDMYTVVINHEEQYSLWPAGRAVPAGWRETGMTGDERSCLDWIKDVWTDMRPESVRRAMDRQGE